MYSKFPIRWVVALRIQTNPNKHRRGLRPQIRPSRAVSLCNACSSWSSPRFLIHLDSHKGEELI